MGAIRKAGGAEIDVPNVWDVQAEGEPVIHFDASCHGAEAYRELANEIAAQEEALRQGSAAG